jgi:hypothetical protein
MKAAARTALVPALALCAALTAAPGGAWAGGEPIVPFPGAASAGGERTTEAAPRPSGETAASPVAPPGTPAAGMPAGKGAPRNRVRETAAETPAGGSRLLRALAETPGAPAAPDDGASGSSGAAHIADPGVPGTRVFAAEGCPRALLRRLLAGAAGEADALSALGIEREILSLCRERQEILVGLFEAEAALRELRTPPSAAAGRAAVAPPPPPRQVAPATRPGAPSPLLAALAAADTAHEADTGAGDTRAGDTGAKESQTPRYAWFSIVGSAGALRAGVTDGSAIWFVREGDALPGGARIAAIAGRPPGVRVTGGNRNGDDTLLPYGARPGGAP